MKLRAIIFLILCALIYSACSRTGTEIPTNSSPAPVVIALVDSVYPADAATGVSGLQEARIYFSEATDDTTISSNDFSISGRPPYVVRQYGKIVYLDFYSGLKHGQIYKIIVSSEISDTLGNKMSSAYDWSFMTEFGPGVESHQPTNGAIDVPIDAVIEVTFNRDMDPSTINDLTFVVGGGIPGQISYNNRTARFIPNGLLEYDRLYEVTLFRWAKDTAGDRLDQDYSWSFRTIEYVDSLPPRVIYFAPKGGEVSLDSPIMLIFNELIDTTTVNALSFYLDDSTSGSYSFDGTSVAFTPDELLKMNHTYTVTVTDDITDTLGLPLESGFSWSFTTEEVITPALMPLAIGNKWYYEKITRIPFGSTTESTDSIVIVASEEIDSETWYIDQNGVRYTVRGDSFVFEDDSPFTYYFSNNGNRCLVSFPDHSVQ